MIRRMLVLGALLVTTMATLAITATTASAQYVPGTPGIIVDPGSTTVGGTITVAGHRAARPTSTVTIKIGTIVVGTATSNDAGNFTVHDHAAAEHQARSVHGARPVRRSRPHRRAERVGPAADHHDHRPRPAPCRRPVPIRACGSRSASASSPWVGCSCWPPAAVAASSSRPESARPTATWYEILGVAPDASHDDVKRAYTAAALEWHPDHWREASPDERETGRAPHP